jgi:hypothetical protein
MAQPQTRRNVFDALDQESIAQNLGTCRIKPGKRAVAPTTRGIWNRSRVSGGRDQVLGRSNSGRCG